MKITLKVFKSENLLFGQLFDNGVYRVGRSEFSNLVINDESLPRTALEIRITDVSVYVTNLASPGHLVINGRKQETGELKEGSVLEISGYKIAVVFGAEAEAQQEHVPKQIPVAAEAAQNNVLLPDHKGFEDNPFFSENLMPDSEGKNSEKSPPDTPVEPVSENAAQSGDKNVFDFPVQQAVESPAENPISAGNLALKDKTDTVGKPLVAKIVMIEGPRAGEEIPLQSFELSFGRSSKADVVIADKKLSRIHAKIIRFGNGYRVIDLNSHNGTRVNGVRILEHPLSSYDVVELGDTKIKFLIHDLILNEKGSSSQLALMNSPQKDPTKSLFLEDGERQEISLLRSEMEKPLEGLPPSHEEIEEEGTKNRSPLKIILVVIIAVALSIWVMSNKEEIKRKAKPETSVESKTTVPEKTVILPKIPTGFTELSEDMQRRIEGYYSTAVNTFQKIDLTITELERSREELKRIHQSIPYYKNSRELLDQLDKRYRTKLDQIALEKAKKDAVEDLNLYLEDGVEHLKQGEFELASEAFTLALNLDPRNSVAIRGYRAAELKVRDLENLPAEIDPEEEKRLQIKELYEKALQELNNRAYQEAIDLAEKMRKINLKSDQTYLNEAKQIIDRARMAQKEEFEPFLIQAKEKFSEGDYNAARDLCEEMLKRDPAYEDAKELLQKSKKQLNRLAKEAYTHGYILESIGQIEQAKQYWNRAKNYVREGDEYFDKVNKKLEQYQ
ncbi:MAG: FHA domain-containing protein [Deltaproteobacteria bacterium]|nr:FHA domain-containing protein [Deltaproteobacteria bacterium]